MTNFLAAGLGGHSVVAWLDQIRLPTPPNESNPASLSFSMDVDDPWDWDTDRVVQEFCTENRSWQLRSASMATPDPVALGKALRQEEVSGDSLLNDVNNDTLRNDFGLHTFGQRAFFNYGIEILRQRSVKYQAQLHTNKLEDEAISKLGEKIDNLSEIVHRTLELSGEHQPKLLIAGPSSNTDAAQVEDFDSEDACNKRRKLDSSNSLGNVDYHFDDGSDHRIEGSLEEHGILTPAPELSSDPAPDTGKKRKRIAPTLITSEIDPNRYRGLPTAADEVIINDPNRNRETPAADEVIEDEQPPAKPGVPFIDVNGRKRLVPVVQARVENVFLQPEITNDKALSIKPGIKSSKPKNSTAQKAAPGYLGRRKMAVDDLFYAGIAVGEDMPILDDTTEMEFVSKGIPSGQKLYVNSAIKRFLRAPRQDIKRGENTFSAITPYSGKLTPKYQKQSFTLFYADESGEIHARREELSSWAEIDPSATIQDTITDAHSSSFNPTGPGVLADLGRYEEAFDPSYLENKYKYLEGGDEVLTVYGHSDEENEYDLATWKEIEDERGEKVDRPDGKTSKRAHISPEEVDEAIDQGISELVAKWNTKKLPKLSIKGYRLWRKSRKQGDKKPRIIAAQEDLKTIHRRITNMRNEIMDDVWTSQTQVLKQVPIMEVDVFTREELNWKIRVLEQVICPERPPPGASVASSKKSTILDDEEGESIDSEGEISSSDDGFDDFVIADELMPTTEQELHELNLADSEEGNDDEEEDLGILGLSGEDSSFGASKPKAKTSRLGDITLNNTSPDKSMAGFAPLSSPSPDNIGTPVKAEQRSLPLLRREPEVFDLTGVTSSDETPAPDNRSGDEEKVIDLVTPQKPKLKIIHKNSPFRRPSSPIDIVDSDDEPMPDKDNLPPLDDPRAVAKFSHVAWARSLDNKRLLVSVFQQMKKDMRTAMLDFVSSLSEDEMWAHMNTVIDAFKDYYARQKATGQISFRGVKGVDPTTLEILSSYIIIFEMFIDCCFYTYREIPTTWAIQKVIDQKEAQFTAFYEFCLTLEGIFARQATQPSSSAPPCKDRDGKVVANPSDDEDDDEEDEDVRIPRKRRSQDIR